MTAARAAPDSNWAGST